MRRATGSLSQLPPLILKLKPLHIVLGSRVYSAPPQAKIPRTFLQTLPHRSTQDSSSIAAPHATPTFHSENFKTEKPSVSQNSNFMGEPKQNVLLIASKLALALDSRDLILLFKTWIQLTSVLFRIQPSNTYKELSNIQTTIVTLGNIRNETPEEALSSISTFFISENSSILDCSPQDIAERLYFIVLFSDTLDLCLKRVFQNTNAKIVPVFETSRFFCACSRYIFLTDFNRANTFIKLLCYIENKYSTRFSFNQIATLILSAHKAKIYVLPGLLYSLALSRVTDIPLRFENVSRAMLNHFGETGALYQSTHITLDKVTKDMEAFEVPLTLNDYYWIMAFYGHTKNIEMIFNLYHASMNLTDKIVTEKQCKSLYNALSIKYNNTGPANNLKLGNPKKSREEAAEIGKFCIDQLSQLIKRQIDVSRYTIFLLSKALSRMSQKAALKAVMGLCRSKGDNSYFYPLTEYLKLLTKRRLPLDPDIHDLYSALMDNLFYNDFFMYQLFHSHFQTDDYGNYQIPPVDCFPSDVESFRLSPLAATLYLSNNIKAIHEHKKDQKDTTYFENNILDALNMISSTILPRFYARPLSALLANLHLVWRLGPTCKLLNLAKMLSNSDSIPQFISLAESSNILPNDILVTSYMQSQRILSKTSEAMLSEWWFGFWQPNLIKLDNVNIFIPSSYTITTILSACIDSEYYDLGLKIWDSLVKCLLDVSDVLYERLCYLLGHEIFFVYTKLLCLIEDQTPEDTGLLNDIFSGNKNNPETFDYEKRIYELFAFSDLLNFKPHPRLICDIIDYSSQRKKRQAMELALSRLRSLMSSGNLRTNYLQEYIDKKLAQD